MKLVLNQFLRFAAVGAVATAFHYAVMFSLVEFAAVNPVWATVCGFLVGAVVSYSLNRVFTFAASKPAFGRGLAKFFAVVAVGAVMNAGIVWFLTGQGLHYMIAQVIATVLVLFWNFGSSRLLVFRAE